MRFLGLFVAFVGTAMMVTHRSFLERLVRSSPAPARVKERREFVVGARIILFLVAAVLLVTGLAYAFNII